VDAVLQKHCEEIASLDGIIVHPNRWGMPPAVLNGGVDRIMRPGVACEFPEEDSGEGAPHELLNAKKAIVFNTSNTFTERELHIFGDPLETLWKNCIFELCGVKEFYRKTYSVVVTSSLAQREAWLEDVRETVAEYFQEKGCHGSIPPKLKHDSPTSSISNSG
jgi:NAD(P)H dehydrogenase (quinone)